MEKSKVRNDHHKISPTAKITAYWRSLSDIPYSVEIANSVAAEQTAKQILADKIELMANFSPLFIEARYKSINYVLKRRRFDNVLELACGLSPRGLEWAIGNGYYVGTDLSEIHAEISPIISGIASRMGISTENLCLRPANVLCKEQLEDAVKHFTGKTFGICIEGLLMYLNREEQLAMAQHVRDLLIGGGGSWVTTDVIFGDLRGRLLNSLTPELKKIYESVLGDISGRVGRDIAGNDFADELEAAKFFEALGFRIETFPIFDSGYKLSTLSTTPEEMMKPVLNILSEANGWILTPQV